VAKCCGDLCCPALYEMLVEAKGLPYLKSRPPTGFASIPVTKQMAAKVIVLRKIESIGNIIRVLARVLFEDLTASLDTSDYQTQRFPRSLLPRVCGTGGGLFCRDDSTEGSAHNSLRT